MDEAKAYILETAFRSRGDAHDVEIDGLARVLEDAALQLERAKDYARGVTYQTHYGSGQSPAAAKTQILYDAAWELVMEGLLRPGKRHFGTLNVRESGYCLTEKGRQSISKGA